MNTTKLQSLLDECRWAIIEDIEESIKCGLRNACVTVNTNDGWVDIYSSRDGDTDVLVYHDDNREHSNERLEDYICEYVSVDWSGIEQRMEEEREDEFDAHGFADAEDYWRYRL